MNEKFQYHKNNAQSGQGLPSGWPSSSLNSTQFNTSVVNPFDMAAPSVLPMSGPGREYASSIGPSGLGTNASFGQSSGQAFNFASPYRTEGDGFSAQGGLSFSDNYGGASSYGSGGGNQEFLNGLNAQTAQGQAIATGAYPVGNSPAGFGGMSGSTQNVLAMTNNSLAQAGQIVQSTDQALSESQAQQGQAPQGASQGDETQNAGAQNAAGTQGSQESSEETQETGGGIGSNLGASDEASETSGEESQQAEGTQESANSENPQAAENPEQPPGPKKVTNSKELADSLLHDGIRKLTSEDLEHVNFKEIMESGDYTVEQKRQMIANMDISGLKQSEQDILAVRFADAASNGFANEVGVEGSDLSDRYSDDDLERIGALAENVGQPIFKQRLDLIKTDIDAWRNFNQNAGGGMDVNGWIDYEYLERDNFIKAEEKLAAGQTITQMVASPPEE